MSPWWTRCFVQCRANRFPIKGFLETSFIDWKGHLSSVMFSGGCNFRCPYCHNSELVLHHEAMEDISFPGILANLRKFRQWVERVVITGGEPTIHQGLFEVIKAIKKEGLKVKLDTNGSSPETIRKLVDQGFVDYVAMDIKGPVSGYGRWCGVDITTTKIEESIAFILEGRVDYEFRMTIVPFLHREDDVYEVAQSISQAKRFVVQAFKPQNTLNPVFSHIHPYSPDKIKKIRRNVAEIMHREGTRLHLGTEG